jgi:hypothetical protein
MDPVRIWRAGAGLACLGMVALASFYLLTEHLQHTLGPLPYLLLLLCPALHLFAHAPGQHPNHGRGEEP